MHELLRKSRQLDPGLRVRAGVGVLRVVWNGVFLPPAANLDARGFISLPAGGPGHAGDGRCMHPFKRGAAGIRLVVDMLMSTRY